MSQFDPMKDPTDKTNTEQNTYTYRTDDGRGYTNPDGSHGFIYNPEGMRGDRKTRRYRGVMIALSTMIVALLLVICCLAGAFFALDNLGPVTPPKETTADTNQGTSDGISIQDPDKGDSTLPGDGEETTRPVITPGRPLEGVLPPMTSIEKLPPKRQDTNGDGIAEIETDENGQVLTSASDANMTVATVVNRVAASVVEITTETVTQQSRLGQYVSAGAGSGVIISKEGYIVTNHHVVKGATTITVRLSNGTEFGAYLVGSDEQSDIAVLWIDAGSYPLTVATLGASFDLVVGEDILAIGNPLGSLGGTVTEGMISATARQISVSGNVMTLLQVSAPINPGNSGGGLFNMAGELVGIVNAKVADQTVEGLGFAIPVDTAYDIILEIVKHGYVQGRPALGFEVLDVTSYQTAMRYFNSFYLGVYVYDKNHDVMQYGDLILSVNGVKLETAADLQAMVSEMEVGDTLEFVVYRNREKKTVTVKVTEQIPETEKNPK